MSMRHITRRDFLRSSAAAVAAMAVPGIGLAQEYPTKAIKIIVGFAPGGTTDSLPRILSNGMAAKLGQPVIVENKLGAAGNIATTFVAQSPPDGYTLLASSVGQIVVSPFTSEMAVDPMKDLVHITMFGEGDQYLTIPGDFPAKNYQEFVSVIKKNPGKYFHGDSGAGGNMHLYLEYYKRLAGLQMEAVHFKGGSQIVLDLVSNRVQMSLLTYAVIEGFVKQGKLRPILVFGKQRDARYPELPTVAEVGLKPLEAASNWFGLHAPKGTPAAIVQKLNAAVVSALNTEEGKKGLATVVIRPGGDSPEHFSARIASEYEVFRKVAKETGVRQQE
jgi:tripartite-type tricarboxylate transporter receptor subunit TctC